MNYKIICIPLAISWWYAFFGEKAEKYGFEKGLKKSEKVFPFSNAQLAPHVVLWLFQNGVFISYYSSYMERRRIRGMGNVAISEMRGGRASFSLWLDAPPLAHFVASLQQTTW